MFVEVLLCLRVYLHVENVGCLVWMCLEDWWKLNVVCARERLEAGEWQSWESDNTIRPALVCPWAFAAWIWFLAYDDDAFRGVQEDHWTCQYLASSYTACSATNLKE